MDVRPAGLERQGPVALGQRLGVTTGLLEDQAPLQVVAGERRVVGRRQPDRAVQVVERLPVFRPQPVEPGRAPDARPPAPGPGRSLGCNASSASSKRLRFSIGLRQIDVRLELVGLQGDRGQEVFGRGLVVAPGGSASRRG